jgi:predicted CXXCH cytochrome family protein
MKTAHPLLVVPRPGLRTVLLALMLLAFQALPQGSALGAVSVLNSPHNLSSSGGRGKHRIAFAEEQRVCIFCHAPHNTSTVGPLWGRGLAAESGYRPYDSTTLKATPKPDKPTGASRLCLSCHDGTIALGQFVGSTITTSTVMPWDANPTKNSNLTTDLSNSHPISFAYSQALAAAQGELAYPAALPPQVKLEHGVLQCTACHDPHNYEFRNFLVLDNNATGSPLCVACHKNNGWPTSAHNPANTPALAAGCMACHYVHSAPEPARLLQSKREEDNCLLNCHNNSGGALQNVKQLFDPALHRHPVDLTTEVHDENERLPAQINHVECVDCHNPHQASASNVPLASPPYINGPLAGVRIDNAAGIATKEFQVCFKCHAGLNSNKFAGISETPPNRVIQESDQSKRFDGANPSFHPVMAQSRTGNSSLLTPLQSSMIMIYCSDCHNSESSVRAGGIGPSGPHGSRWEHILIARYDMPLVKAIPPPYSASLYDLCFRCHYETFIMGSGSGFVNAGTNEHARHVKDRGTPCYVCHDPHGVSTQSIPPATTQNNAHLINFNRDYTASTAIPTPSYSSTGVKGCTVACHTAAGGTHTYGP